MKGKKKTNINKQWSWAKEAWSGESEDVLWVLLSKRYIMACDFLH